MNLHNTELRVKERKYIAQVLVHVVEVNKSYPKMICKQITHCFVTLIFKFFPVCTDQFEKKNCQNSYSKFSY